MWLVIGFLGQFIFSLRFLVQWISSEKRKKTHVPVVFWYLSLLGSFLVLVYSIHLQEPVFIVGQVFGIIVYVRNLILINNNKTSQESSVA